MFLKMGVHMEGNSEVQVVVSLYNHPTLQRQVVGEDSNQIVIYIRQI